MNPKLHTTSVLGAVISKGSYSAGFGLTFVAEFIGGLILKRSVKRQKQAFSVSETDGIRNEQQLVVARTKFQLSTPTQGKKNVGQLVFSIVFKVKEWLYFRLFPQFSYVERRFGALATRKDGIWEYALVTIAYWGITITDGAIRMLILFHFYLLGYSALQIASLFLFYEIFGVITNLFGGWIGANMGLRVTTRIYSGLY